MNSIIYYEVDRANIDKVESEYRSNYTGKNSVKVTGKSFVATVL